MNKQLLLNIQSPLALLGMNLISASLDKPVVDIPQCQMCSTHLGFRLASIMFSGFIFRIVQITTPLYLWLIKFCVLDVTNAISIHPLTGTLFSSFEATMNIQVQVLPMARERAQQVTPDTLSLTPGTLIKQACVVLSSVMPALLQETGDSMEVHTGGAAQEQRGWDRSCIDMGEGQNQLPKPVQPHTHTPP